MRESDFREVADEFIRQANAQKEAWTTHFLNASFMYAAAWYNTHQIYTSDGADENQRNVVDFFCDQYRKMLMECMHDLSGSN
ncbi:MAG: DUF3144 domain-containing protein [Candidatus Thiodiazotropha sp.]